MRCRLIYFLFGIITFTFLVSCISPNTNNSTKQITVSISPQKYFVEKISEDRYNIQAMIPPGANPATYEPSPKQMQQLSQSEYYFQIGYIPFEKVWIPKFKSQFSQVSFKDISTGIGVIKRDYSHSPKKNNTVGIDPHFWVSPKRVKVLITNIYKTFIETDSLHRQFYKSNYDNFYNVVDSLDNDIQNSFSQYENKAFLIYHPALTYFAKDYGLQQIPIQIEGKEPSPAYMQKVIDIAKSKNIQTVLIQKQFDVANAKTIANAINGEVVQINPLAENWLQSIIHIHNTLLDIVKKQNK